MAAPKIRSDFDTLNQLAQKWNALRDAAQNTNNALRGRMGVLRGGDWVGDSAERFYAEMDSVVFPAMARLINAFQLAADVTRQISQLMQQAEQDASGMLNGKDVGGSGGGSSSGDDNGRVVVDDGRMNPDDGRVVIDDGRMTPGDGILKPDDSSGSGSGSGAGGGGSPTGGGAPMPTSAPSPTSPTGGGGGGGGNAPGGAPAGSNLGGVTSSIPSDSNGGMSGMGDYQGGTSGGASGGDGSFDSEGSAGGGSGLGGLAGAVGMGGAGMMGGMMGGMSGGMGGGAGGGLGSGSETGVSPTSPSGEFTGGSGSSGGGGSSGSGGVSGGGGTSGGGSSGGGGAPSAPSSFNPGFATDPGSVFSPSSLGNLAGAQFSGAGSPELGGIMQGLMADPKGDELDLFLEKLAKLRGRSLDEIRKEYSKFMGIKGMLGKLAQQFGQIMPANVDATHMNFMGSLDQMRSGSLVGQAFGIDPVFGAMLNPTGGMIGATNGLFSASEPAAGLHFAAQSAAHFLQSYFHAGPGDSYLGKGGISEAIGFWREQASKIF